jgi:predicted NBD/HSP70 family sugar kinase
LSIDKLKLNTLAANGTQSTILQVVRDNGPVSRSGIVSLTGQPHAAISRSTAILLSKNILVEDGGTDTKGPRKKRGLRLNPNSGYVIGIEYGPDGIEAVAMNTAYQPITKSTKTIDITNHDQNEILELICTAIKNIQKDVKMPASQCLGIAAVDPGLIDDDAGVSVLATTMERWSNVPVVKVIEEQLKLPVLLLGTSTAKILAVDRLELNNSIANLLYIEYGKGIACGMKLNNTYISGHGHLAGELGHLQISNSQAVCRCGGVGCLEAVASLTALAKTATASIESNNSNLSQKRKLTGMDVLLAAAQQDKLASRIVDEAFERLGAAVAGIVNILSPKMVIFDSIINKAGSEAVAVLMRSLHKTVLASHQRQLEIRISSLTSHIGALGGAAAILDACLID